MFEWDDSFKFSKLPLGFEICVNPRQQAQIKLDAMFICIKNHLYAKQKH